MPPPARRCPLPGEVLPPHAATADGAPLAQVARRDLALRPIVALTLPDCTSVGPPRLHQRQNGQAAKSLAGKVIRHAGGQTAAALGDPPAQAGAPGGEVPGFPPRHTGRRRHLFHHRQPAKGLSHHGNSGLGHSVSPLSHGQTPVPVKQTQGPAYATKNPGISWDTRDSRIFNMKHRNTIDASNISKN